MFCKWCGNTIRPEEKSCPACGRETPPMSDCGGFYNLKFSQQEVNVKDVPFPSVSSCPIVEEKGHKYALDQKKAKRHYKIMTIAMVVLLLLTAISSVGFCSLHIHLEQISEQNQNRPSDIAVTASTKATEQINDIRMPYWFQLHLTVGEDIEVSVNQDLADYLHNGKFKISLEEADQEKIIRVLYVAGQESDYVDLTVSTGMTADGIWKIGIACDTDILLFSDAAYEYCWEYRENAGTWLDVDDSMVFWEETGAQYVEWDMPEAHDNSPGGIELRCRIHVVNADGDEMILMADGISVFYGEEMETD